MCLCKLFSVFGWLVDLLVLKIVVLIMYVFEIVFVYWKLYIEGESSEVRFNLVKWILIYEGCFKNVEISDIIKFVKEIGGWNLCYSNFDLIV